MSHCPQTRHTAQLDVSLVSFVLAVLSRSAERDGGASLVSFVLACQGLTFWTGPGPWSNTTLMLRLSVLFLSVEV